MKIKFFLLIFAVSVMFVGCSSKKAQSHIGLSDDDCMVGGDKAPDWICKPFEKKGYFTAFGTSVVDEAGFDFARTDATASAKASLALQVGSKIDVLVKRFVQNTGVKGSAVDQVKVQNTNHIASVTLNGAKQLDFWESPKNRELFILVGVEKDKIFDNLSGKLSSTKSENIQWQQFMAEQSDKEMKVKISEAQN